MPAAFVVKSKPVEGREAEFNDWYDNHHVPDVLAVPGFVAAQRFRADAAAPGHPYLAIYEIEGDARAAMEALTSAVRNGMYMSDALESSDACLYTALGERIASVDLRADRSGV
jgi:hypothetical protein